jgi:hypothetical protein
MTAMIVCILEHVQWRRALNGSLARGHAGRAASQATTSDRPPSAAAANGVAPALFGCSASAQSSATCRVKILNCSRSLI